MGQFVAATSLTEASPRFDIGDPSGAGQKA